MRKESFFGDNVLVQGGTFTQSVRNVYPQESGNDGFYILQKHVAPSAFHNSAQRIDPPKCHPNTRNAVIQRIFRWILDDGNVKTPLLWLNGAAGAGKSAIAQSVAEMCLERNVSVLSFFLYRTDSTRNNFIPLVATLAYQLIQITPETREHIVQTIADNPLIFELSLDVQLSALIINPLQQLLLSRQTSKLKTASWRLLLLIDGLDECSSGHSYQVQLINSITDMLTSHAQILPISVLISSRAENHLSMAFSARRTNSLLLRVSLDDKYIPNDDIRLFLVAKFAEVRTAHPFNDSFGPSWPAPEAIDELVKRSSGQFIYAAVAMRFIASPRAHPVQQLAIIRGLHPAAQLMPFAELDALYFQIFAQVADLAAVMRLLVFAVISKRHSLQHICCLFEITEMDVHCALVDMTSVVVCKDGKIQFLHASLPDFLLDKQRSRELHIDVGSWSAQIAHLWFERTKISDPSKSLTWTAILPFINQADATAQLREDIMTFEPSQNWLKLDIALFLSFMAAVQELDFNDEGEAYSYQLELVTRLIRRVKPDGLEQLSDHHKISSIMKQIDKEEVSEAQVEVRARPWTPFLCAVVVALCGIVLYARWM